MNFINKGFLKLALFPSLFYKKAGVDVYQLKNILTTKLTMDDRRVHFMSQISNTKKEKKVSGATLGTMFISVLVGFAFIFSFYTVQDPVTQLTFYFSMFFFMLSLILMADFTSVLIDVRDNFIILPKPVTDRTFIVARLLHIFIHLMRIILPMGLPGMSFVYGFYGLWATIVFLFVIFIVVAFAILFINAVYILILKITSPQRFQSFISYIQIFFAVVLTAGYQIFPRLLSLKNVADFEITSLPAIVLYPVYWFACTWKALYSFQSSGIEWMLAILGIVTPIVSVYIVVKYLAPSFNNKLAMITASGGAPENTTLKVKTNRSSYSNTLANLFSRTHAEKMGFLFTWKMTSRSRDFKLKVYPSIGYMLVYFFFIALGAPDSIFQDIASQNSKGKIIIISGIYFTTLMLIMAINQIIYSDKYKASWIYYTAPLNKPGEIILGAAKAAILKFYIPMLLVVTLVGLLLVGISILPNILLGLLNQILVATVLVYAGNKMFPFSTHQNNNFKAGVFIRNLFVFTLCGIIGVLHYFIYSMLPVVVIFLVLSGIAVWFIMDSIRSISWQVIKSSYAGE